MPETNIDKKNLRRIFSKKIGLVILVTLYIISGLLVASLYGLQKSYADRIYPGVTIAGLDFSGLAWEEAEKQVEELVASLEKTTVPIEVEGGSQVFQPTLGEVGVHFDKDAVLSSLFAIGHGANFRDGVISALKSLAGSQSVDLAATFDEEILQGYVDRTTASLAKKAQNAGLKVVNGIVEIIPATIGEEANPEYLANEIRQRLQSLRISAGSLALSSIFLEIARAEPPITDQDVEPVQKEAQAMVGEAITMEFEGKTYTLTPADIGSWLVFKEVETQGEKTYQPEFDDAKISSSIGSKVARSIDIKMVPKKILITTGQVIEEGHDGRSLDRTALLSQIKLQLANHNRTPVALAATTVPKTEQQVYPDFTLGLYEGKYVEINLVKQMLYAIEGSVLVGSYPVSTGKWSSPTPMGTLYIVNKHPNPKSPPKYPYTLWMPYWNGLSTTADFSGYEGYGIHELPCFNSSCTRREGLGHLGTPVSHGCIRLGIGPAAFLYDWAIIGTPVYIHS